MDCLTEATVLAVVEHRVDGEHRREVSAHVDTCARCSELLAHTRLALGSNEGRPRVEIVRDEHIFERYELGPEIARGGMGRIVAARDRRLDRPVALKLALSSDPSLARRFVREVALTSQLEHPAIVAIHDAGTTDDGTPFYAMRLVGGESLVAMVERAGSVADRLALIPHVLAAADALAYAHARGVIHRDVKPHNILVGEFGETVLVDWGLAKRLDEAELPASAGTESPTGTTTVQGTVVGTPSYMAPEQQRGAHVDYRADVYGLGATLHHVLAQKPPARASDLRALGVPEELVAIVERAMATDPEARYASAAEVAAELRRFQAGRLVEAHRYTAWQRLARWVRRHRAPLIVASVAVVLVIVLSIVGIMQIVGERRRAIAERDAARGLVHFAMGDLHDRLENFGRLDLLASTANEVMTYYDKAPGHSLDGDRIEAMTVYGETQVASGHVAPALDMFEKALALVDRSVSPHAPKWRCRVNVDIGDAARAAGDISRASLAYQACYDDARPRVTDPGWRRAAVKAGLRRAETVVRLGDEPQGRALAESVISLPAPSERRMA